MTYRDFDDTYWLYGDESESAVYFEGERDFDDRRDYWISNPYFDWLRHIEGFES